MNVDKFTALIAEAEEAAEAERDDGHWARTQQIRDTHYKKAALLENMAESLKELTGAANMHSTADISAAALTEYVEAFKNNPSSAVWGKNDVIEDIIEWRDYNYGSPSS